MKRITFLALIAIVIYLLIERDREQQEGLFWRKRVEAFEARDRQRDEQAKRDEEEAKLYLQFLDEVYPEEHMTEEKRSRMTAASIDSELMWQETNVAFQEWKGNKA